MCDFDDLGFDAKLQPGAENPSPGVRTALAKLLEAHNRARETWRDLWDLAVKIGTNRETRIVASVRGENAGREHVRRERGVGAIGTAASRSRRATH